MGSDRKLDFPHVLHGDLPFTSEVPMSWNRCCWCPAKLENLVGWDTWTWHIELIHTEMIWYIYIYIHIYIHIYIYICIDIIYNMYIYIYELWLYCISKDIEWDPNTVLHLLFFPWFLWLFPGCWRRWPSITWAGYWNHFNNPLRVTYSNKVRFSVWMCLSVLLFPLWIYWFVCIYCIWY